MWVVNRSRNTSSASYKARGATFVVWGGVLMGVERFPSSVFF